VVVEDEGAVYAEEAVEPLGYCEFADAGEAVDPDEGAGGFGWPVEVRKDRRCGSG